jgi:hypothetical protein
VAGVRHKQECTGTPGGGMNGHPHVNRNDPVKIPVRDMYRNVEVNNSGERIVMDARQMVPDRPERGKDQARRHGPGGGEGRLKYECGRGGSDGKLGGDGRSQ